MTTDFFHAHIHGEHSILDGFTTTSDIPGIAKERGFNSIALSDHGTLGGAMQFWEAAKEAEIKGVFAVEAYVTPDLRVKEKDSPTWHLILLAKNRVGLENLFALSKIGWTDGFYKKPRVDYVTLSQHSEGLIALSACMASEISRAMEQPEGGYRITPEAVAAGERYSSIFPGAFYIELQPGNSVALNTALSDLAGALGLPVTVTVDSHYDHCASKATEELLLVMQQTAGAKASDRDYAKLMFDEAKRETNLLSRLDVLWPNRGLSYTKHELHIMSREEVVNKMDAQGFDGNALADSTLEISERCEQVELIRKGVHYLPKLVKSLDSDEYLRALVYDGLEERGLADKQEYIDRVEEELALIKEKKFSDYFLIVWDIINEARRRNIYVGPGRGSAAGSLCCYALKITARDPIKRKLLFFRFLDPSRSDFPDIDMDFEHTRRDEMKQYMEEKYGERLGLATYTRFQAKGCVQSIARALAIPLQEVMDANKHYNTLDEYEQGTAPKLVSFRNRHPEVGVYARELEGHITATGAHAAAVVVADRPMTEIVPVETRTDPEDKKQRIPVSAWDMWDAEKAGLIKFDFLGLNTLSVIHSCIDLIKERHGVDIEWEEMEETDEDVLALLNDAHTNGVFQMESSAYRKLLKDMGVDNFNDVVASNALVRPGAFDTVAKDYIRRKRGLEQVTYPHPDAEEWLKDTFGVAIYQEQVMALSVVIGGFSWAEANKLRKIIGKKRDVAEFQPFFEKWMEGATKKISTEEAEKLWHDFEKHANYSFNLSHADSYSYMSYVTAWLKFHYPLEFMYSLLKHEDKDTTKMSYLLDAKRAGIDILGPDVNLSDADMKVDGEALRFGLSDIKGVGVTASDFLISNRPWESWEDWNNRIVPRKVNSRVVESLVAVDALRTVLDAPVNSSPEKNYMEYLNYPIDLESVAELGIEYEPIENYEEGGEEIIVCGVVKGVKRTDRYMRMELEDITGTLTCFGNNGNDLSNGELVIALVGDKSMMGYARIEGLKERIENGNLTGFEKLLLGKTFTDLKPLRRFNIGGVNDDKALVVPLSIRRITTKTGKKMAFAHITDGEHVIKLTIFPDDWTQYEYLIREYVPICVQLRWLDDGGRTLARNGVIDAYDLMEKTKDK